MNNKKVITIYDIAKKLNYSASTISRALNNQGSISKKTVKIIKDEAEKMGYRANSIAASLRSNNSKTIGVLIPRINRPFMSTLISGIEEQARKEGYNVIISQSNDNYETEVQNAKALFDLRISGLIASLAMETRDYKHFEQFLNQDTPVVFVDRVPKNFPSYQVVIDNYTASFNATKHLIDEGCKNIAHFAGTKHLSVYNDRRRGYEDALKEHNIVINKNLIITFETMSFEEGKKALKKLLKLDTPPDGIFSANDTAATGAMVYAKEQGISIPDQLAFIGFNDDIISSIVDPPLSTVFHPAEIMGKISARCILQHEENNNDIEKVSQVNILSTNLILRQSSQKKSFSNKEC